MDVWNFKAKKKAELTDTHVPAFIESRAALGFAPVHRFFTMSVGSTVTDPKERNDMFVTYLGSETRQDIPLHILKNIQVS